MKFKKTENKVLNTTSLETKFQVRVVAQPEEKDNNETYRKGLRRIQSLNANQKSLNRNSTSQHSLFPLRPSQREVASKISLYLLISTQQFNLQERLSEHSNPAGTKRAMTFCVSQRN